MVNFWAKASTWTTTSTGMVNAGNDVMSQATVFTIGHSNRTFADFADLLKDHNIEEVIDVRTVPRSRHNPQFNQDTLPGTLEEMKIGYRLLKGLGGLRHPQVDSVNKGWRNATFQGFADYMQTREFEENLEVLITLAKEKRIVIMCAEAVPWRCHRSLIGDALLVRGFQVERTLSAKPALSHTFLRPGQE